MTIENDIRMNRIDKTKHNVPFHQPTQIIHFDDIFVHQRNKIIIFQRNLVIDEKHIYIAVLVCLSKLSNYLFPFYICQILILDI